MPNRGVQLLWGSPLKVGASGRHSHLQGSSLPRTSQVRLSCGLGLPVPSPPEETYSRSPNLNTLDVHLWFSRMNLSLVAHCKPVKEHFGFFHRPSLVNDRDKKCLCTHMYTYSIWYNDASIPLILRHNRHVTQSCSTLLPSKSVKLQKFRGLDL